MPSVSKAQAKLMRAAAHSKEFAKKVGIKQETAKEWSDKDSKERNKKLPEHVKDKKSSNETYVTTASLNGSKGFKDH